MQFSIQGHHIDVSPALKNYVEKKIVSKLNQRFNNITQINVTLRVEKLEQKAEASVNLSGNRGPLFADSSSEDMYSSIDLLSAKLDKQIEKYKAKLNSQHRDDELY